MYLNNHLSHVGHLSMGLSMSREPVEELRAEARGISAEPLFLRILLLLFTQQEIPTQFSLLPTCIVEEDPCPWLGGAVPENRGGR